LLVYWDLAVGIFQTPGYTRPEPRATIPSFNFADIFNVGQTGLTCSGKPCGILTTSGTPIYPVQPFLPSFRRERAPESTLRLPFGPTEPANHEAAIDQRRWQV
jgi:hypothetical protein